MQGTYRPTFSRHRNDDVVLLLAVYLAASFTNLPTWLVICPLVISGVFLLFRINDLPQEVLTKRDPLAATAIALFLASYLVSVLFSDDIFRSLNGFAVIFTGLLVAYILNHLPHECLRSVSLSFILLVLTCSWICILMFIHSGHLDPGFVFREEKTPALVVPNDMLAGVIFSPFVAYALANKIALPLRILAAASLVSLACAMYLVDSRTCYMTALFMIMLYLFLFHRKNFLWAGMLTLLIFIVIDQSFDLGIVDNLYALKSENARFSVWLAGLAHWSDNPVLGLGPSLFEDAYQSGIQELAFPDWAMIESRRVPWAHNLYIEALVERGMLGLLALTCLLIIIAARIHRQWVATTGSGRGFYIVLSISFCGFLFAGFLESTMQRIWVANSLFIFIGLAFRPSGAAATRV